MTKESLIDFYSSVRSKTEAICKPLEEDAFGLQPIEEVSPPKWHLGHTTWFLESFILEHYFPDYKIFHKDFAFVFNSYYESLGDRVARSERGQMQFPKLDDVYKYRKYVDDHIVELFKEKELNPEVQKLLITGCHHEQQHQELLLTDIKYIYSKSNDDWLYGKLLEVDVPTDALDYISVKEGVYEIGYSGDGFHFDNEAKRHKVYLQGFEIASLPVTNGEFLEFIEDGGYQNFKYWHSDGWQWVKEQKILAPYYWKQINNGWKEFTLGGWEDVNSARAVAHISFYEAFAFAEWKGMRLPTEAEWEVASDLFEWGRRWEWTMSGYLPYPGYIKEEGALGEYNGKFMVNQMVLRGSSIATSKGHSRKTYRNFFHPQYRWQFTGLRLVRK